MHHSVTLLIHQTDEFVPVQLQFYLFQTMLNYCKGIPNWNEKNNKKDWNCSYQFNMSDSTARCSNSSKRKICGGGGTCQTLDRDARPIFRVSNVTKFYFWSCQMFLSSFWV